MQLFVCNEAVKSKPVKLETVLLPVLSLVYPKNVLGTTCAATKLTFSTNRTKGNMKTDFYQIVSRRATNHCLADAESSQVKVGEAFNLPTTRG